MRQTNCLSNDNYAKSLSRLENSLQTRRFSSYSQHKKQQIWKRLCRYAKQLGVAIRPTLVAACIAAGLCIAEPTSAQVAFIQRTGASNPLNAITVLNDPVAAFVDIDNDGDMDLFVGRQAYGTLQFYRNTGNATTPTFASQGSPLTPPVAYNYAPTFVDIDNDGDKDAFVGTSYGNILFYRNTGNATTPTFTSVSGASNPFNGVDVGYQSIPRFVDIDNDGDQDAFISNAGGQVAFYRNTGTVTAPVFTLVAGAANPFNGLPGGGLSVPVVGFIKLDGDADFDVIMGVSDGTVRYYRNTGTVTAPAFTLQTGTNNPFNGLDVGFRAYTSIVDIDGDALQDVFFGVGNVGNFLYFENVSSTLPLTLISFTVDDESVSNRLEWKTGDELNTKLFGIERSSDGSNFSVIGTVNAIGSGDNNYTFTDNMPPPGKQYYRLRMVDIDDRFTYSHVIFLRKGQAGGITLYPSPVEDKLNINTGNNPKLLNTIAYIYSINGRLERSVMIVNTQQQVDLSNLVPGIYTIRFSDGTVDRFMKM